MRYTDQDNEDNLVKIKVVGVGGAGNNAIKNDSKEEKQSTMPVENSENIGKSEDNNQETNSGK